jgi:fructose 1,6-bisphosphate aldolase/phosphatase
MNITISVIKADVGSIGGHTRPSDDMLAAAKASIQEAIENRLILDGLVTFTGDDICLTMSHSKGTENPDIHNFAWKTFLKSTVCARACGCYGAGQDLLADAPSGNVRGAGPGVAEITFDFTQKDPRPAESFMVFAADKCGPGAFNLPLYLAFADTMYCSGLMLPGLIKGFSFDIVDMNTKDEDSIITLHAPEDLYKIALLLRDNDRFGIKSIYSRNYNEQAVSVSTDRLHTIAGKYVGKDDPVALVRNQGMFPAPEELVSPYVKAHFIGGGARGSHIMPLMPAPMNTPVTGPYCLPIVSCIGYSLQSTGKFSNNYVDFFGNLAWDAVRLKAQKKAIEIRSQGWSGPAMLPDTELEYTGFQNVIDELLTKFKKVKK